MQTPDTRLEWWIPGNPVAKGRPRVNRAGWTFTPKRTKEAEQAIATQVKTYLGPYWRVDKTCSWSVCLAFYCKNRVRGDLDNLVKLATDALQGVVYDNDRRIVHLEASIASESSERPGIAIVCRKWDSTLKPSASFASHLGSC